MELTRRSVLAGSIASALVGAGLTGAAAAETVLRAAPGEAQLAPEGCPSTPIWGYDGQTPGPTLRVRQSSRLTRRLANDLPQPTTVHWHGVRLVNAMDGVPGLTQDPVPPGGRFDYDFVLPDAGTYWYRPDDRAWEQMARGLSGALIVDEAEPPDVDADEVLLIDDWRLSAEGRIDASFGALHDGAHAGRLGGRVTVNARAGWSREVRRGDRLRLRLVNVANVAVFDLRLAGLEGQVAALDGQPLAAPAPAGRLRLAPGQRADLLVDVTARAEAALVRHDRDGSSVLASFPVVEGGGARRDTPPPLPPNRLAPLGDLAEARAVGLVIRGGAMGGMPSAMVGGRQTGTRQLHRQGRMRAQNGAAGLPDAPLIEAAQGETVRIALVSDTAVPHAMHLHGHHFRAVAPDGTLGPWRDTLLVDRAARAEVAFVADNLGDWLLHCQMLEHAAGGTTTWLRVG